MNLLNIAKHLLYLAETEYTPENSATTTDEVLAAERLFEVLKSFKDSYFNEMYSYDTLEFEEEFDEIADEDKNDDEVADEESDDEMTGDEENDNEFDDYNEKEHSYIRNRFTLEEMENIIEWVDQHSNARFSTISHRFKKNQIHELYSKI
ncbi:unnamed protein product [Rotaria sp. Silwood2]|nr:unnamed protein product [Rotaria sp. Silwood2]CAF4489128.1 unnamed protein product [Rotaria sp. Silwood2]